MRQRVRSRFIERAGITLLALCAFVASASVASAQRPRFYVALDPGAGLTPARLVTVEAAMSEVLAANHSILLHRAGESAATARAIILARGLLGRQVSWTVSPRQNANGVVALMVEIVISPYPATGAPGSTPARMTVTVTFPLAGSVDDLLQSLGRALGDTLARSLR
jgi:hypothetical protein